MTKLMIVNAEKNNVRVMNWRPQPLITWLYFFNLIAVAILCIFILRIYKNLLLLFKWLFSHKQVPEHSVVLVLGPKNEIIQEMVQQMSQTYNSEIIVCQDLNSYSLESRKAKKHFKKVTKSQIIYSPILIESQEVILKLKRHIQKTFGFVDVLMISQNECATGSSSTHDFLNKLNKQLLAQFWAVMAFLPDMMRKNRGHILSIALGKSSLVNTGIMRTIQEELLQSDTKVTLTLVERNNALDKCYLPSLSSDVLASLIVRSMRDYSSVVKIPSLPWYLIMLPVLLTRFLLKPLVKIK